MHYLSEYEQFEESRKRTKALKEQIDTANRTITSLIFEKDGENSTLQISIDTTSIYLPLETVDNLIIVP